MVHSATNDNGRVLVGRDDENNLVAQSWVWRDKDLICFDDIEFPKTSHFTSLAVKKAGSVSDFTDKILDVYKEVASGMNDSRKEFWKMIDSNPTKIIVIIPIII